MNTSHELFQYLVKNISVYEQNEAKAIAYLLLDELLHLSKTDIILDKPIPAKTHNWQEIINKINQSQPVQYIIGHTEFYGRRFLVNPSVLIPRPETEELIEHLVKKFQHKKEAFKLLDIGTGSGCIAISLAKELPYAEVSAIDISEDALETAKQNAALNEANVRFIQQNILSDADLGKFEVIVSNPPYITQQEAAQMQANVLDFEPHLALFVENHTPLLFYDAILKFAQHSLTTNGLVFVEINENFGKETASLFAQYGYSDIEIIKDIYKKDRFVAGVKS